MTDRQDLCLSLRMDRQLECRSEDIGSQLLSSEQPTWRDLIICVLLMDMSIDETDATSWTQKNLKLTVLTCQSGMKVQNYVQHQPTVDHVMITYNIYIVIRETGQFSSKGIINDFIGNLNRLTVSRRFTEQAV